MRNVDIYGLIIITLFLGGLITFLGWVIKSQNAGDMLNGFDVKKYDKNIVSKIVGKDLFNTGILVISIGAIGVFITSQLYNYITFTQIGIVILGLIKSMYDMEKKCRTKK